MYWYIFIVGKENIKMLKEFVKIKDFYFVIVVFGFKFSLIGWY